jgi:putative redox protein
MTILVRQETVSASIASIRDHRVLIDRPTDKGGADLGPMGGELFLAAIGGCFMSNLLAAIKARDAEIRDAQTEVTGTIEGSPAAFSRIELVVSAQGSAAPELLHKVVEIAERGCIMVNTLRGKLDLSVRIAAASA